MFCYFNSFLYFILINTLKRILNKSLTFTAFSYQILLLDKNLQQDPNSWTCKGISQLSAAAEGYPSEGQKPLLRCS